ncbi:MAG: cold shock domain-containing protein [Nitrosopumilus sp.]
MKWFNPIRGYGFLETEKGEIFFHISEFENYREIRIDVGQEVEFEIGKSPKGDKAVKIKKI